MGENADGTTVHHRTCPLCEATCGLEITVRGTDVVRIRGDREDVFSHGFICPKGSTLKQLHDDPDRLRRPVVRRDGPDGETTWEEVTWDEAFAEIERRLVPIMAAHGRDAVAIYLGNPNVHNIGGTLFGPALIRALGTRNIFSASTVDQMPRHVSCGLMYGGPLIIPVPDLDRTSHLVILGANPLESNGSLCTAPDFPGRLRAIRERGGKVVVVDPRRSATAEVADEHVAIRPGTDAHLLLGILHVLTTEGLVDPGDLAPMLEGVDAVAAVAAPFTPGAVAAATGVPADTVVRMAREIAAAESAAVYGRIGTNTVAFGTLGSWATDTIAALTGNLDRPGGMMFPRPAHQRPPKGGPGRGFRIGRHTSRVKGHPEVRSELPVATLADEVLTPGEGQVRALVTVGGNPALSTPHSDRLTEALGGLELMVSVDVYRNETTRHADIILPPPSALERPQYDLAFYALAVRNIANYSPAIFPAEGPGEGEILARLALVASGQGADADPALVEELVLGAMLGAVAASGDERLGGRSFDELCEVLAATGRSAAEQVVDAMLRTGPYGDWFGGVPDGLSLDLLEQHPHGIDFGALTPELPGILRTPSGMVELAPPEIIADIERLGADLATRAAAGADDGLVLVGRRHLRSNNSWMHNVEVLVKGRERCTLQVHPDDATRLGLTDGKTATVRSRVGELEAPVEVTDAVMAGVVSLPHGWGHDDPATALRVARSRPGVNSNVLTDPEVLDPLSGNAVLNGIPVTVTAAG